MASDFRMLQHDAAMASFNLTSATSHLRELQARYPDLIAAERNDIENAYVVLGRLLDALKDRAA